MAPAETEPVPTATEPRPEASAPGPVELRLEGPPGARVYRGQTLLGTLPDPLRLPWDDDPVMLRVVAPGYEVLELELVPSEDRARRIEMKPRPKSPPSSPHQGADDPPPSVPALDDLEF